jgi:uncharacterized protein
VTSADSEARDSAGLVILEREECLRLLASVPVGRLVFTEHALPAITPVNFLVHDDAVVIPHDESGELAAAADGDVVAFEADEFDATTRSGWSVTVVGRTALVTDAALVTKLSALQFAEWASGECSRFTRIQVAHVAGRRIDTASR